MVSLQVRDGPNFVHVCGGAIIDRTWIVTAAHCVSKQRPLVLALAGVHNLSNPDVESVQRIPLSRIHVHKNYDPRTRENDIALLHARKLIVVIESQGYVNAICLPESDTDPVGSAIVTGWGHTKSGGKSSNTLMEMSVPMLRTDICRNAYDEISSDQRVTDTNICAGSTETDACQNDSGGPLIQTEGSVSTLIGIASFGHGCGYEGLAVVYTKVASYVPWIMGVIRDNGVLTLNARM